MPDNSQRKSVFDLIPNVEFEPSATEAESPLAVAAADLSAEDFALLVLSSREFRDYIVTGLTLKTLPTPIVVRLMEYGWGKPVERVEHTGKDGEPIVTEVRRVIVRAEPTVPAEKPQLTPALDKKPSVH